MRHKSTAIEVIYLVVNEILNGRCLLTAKTSQFI